MNAQISHGLFLSRRTYAQTIDEDERLMQHGHEIAGCRQDGDFSESKAQRSGVKRVVGEGGEARRGLQGICRRE